MVMCQTQSPVQKGPCDIACLINSEGRFLFFLSIFILEFFFKKSFSFKTKLLEGELDGFIYLLIIFSGSTGD